MNGRLGLKRGSCNLRRVEFELFGGFCGESKVPEHTVVLGGIVLIQFLDQVFSGAFVRLPRKRSFKEQHVFAILSALGKLKGFLKLSLRHLNSLCPEPFDRSQVISSKALSYDGTIHLGIRLGRGHKTVAGIGSYYRLDIHLVGLGQSPLTDRQAYGNAHDQEKGFGGVDRFHHCYPRWSELLELARRFCRQKFAEE